MSLRWLALAVASLVCEVGTGAGRALSEHILQNETFAQLQTLGKFSGIHGSLFRPFMSDAHKAAARKIADWMEMAGLEVRIDGIGNVHGIWRASNASAEWIVMGSHYDTVIDAGTFDGVLGILAPIAAMKALLVDQLVGTSDHQGADELIGTYDVRPLLGEGRPAFQRHVHLVAFSDEEGARFGTTFLGSRAFAGTLRPEDLNVRDDDGQSLAEAMGPASRALRALESSLGTVRAYVEAHIEQGPVLQVRGEPVGVVTGIAGQTRLVATFKGQQGHAGTVPMHLRKDPVVPLARLTAALHDLCAYTKPMSWRDPLGWYTGLAGWVVAHVPVVPQYLRFWMLGPVRRLIHNWKRPYLVCTVGKVTLWPGASNSIAAEAVATIDIRSDDNAMRQRVVGWVQTAGVEFCGRAGTECVFEVVHEAAAVQCSTDVTMDLVAAAKDVLGAGSDVPMLASGAGHDAMAMAEVAPVAMLFVRCKDGHSHSPAEYARPEDVATVVRVLHAYLRQQVLL